jgi:hypothetical protein
MVLRMGRGPGHLAGHGAERLRRRGHAVQEHVVSRPATGSRSCGPPSSWSACGARSGAEAERDRLLAIVNAHLVSVARFPLEGNLDALADEAGTRLASRQ